VTAQHKERSRQDEKVLYGKIKTLTHGKSNLSTSVWCQESMKESSPGKSHTTLSPN